MLESKIFWIIIYSISLFIEWYTLKATFNRYSILKSSKIKLNLSLLIAMATLLIMILLKFTPNVKLVTAILIANFIYLYNYEIKPMKSIIIVLLYCLMLIAFDAISISAITLIYSINDINTILSDRSYKIQIIILSRIMILSLLPFVKKEPYNFKITNMQKLSISVPIIANITSILIVFSFIYKDRNITQSEGVGIFIVSIMLLLSNISIIYITSTIIKNNNLSVENKLIKEKIEMRNEHYLNVHEDQQKIKRLYHDLKNHLIYIKNIYGDNEKSCEYIDALQKQLDDIKLPFNTNNMTLDIILNDKKKICNKNNILLFVDIDFTKCNFIEIIDIVSIFSNILDNAMEACDKIKKSKIERRIELKGKIVNNFYIIKCKNPKENDVIFEKTCIKTDKRDSFLHGVGLNSVKLSVEKYGGNVEIDVTKNIFEIIIMIPL